MLGHQRSPGGKEERYKSSKIGKGVSLLTPYMTANDPQWVDQKGKGKSQNGTK